MPDKYISDEHVIINVQGLRTVRRADRPWAAPGSQWMLDWSYKGQENFQAYANEAERDAMYDALRAALTKKASKQQRDSSYTQSGTTKAACAYNAVRAARVFLERADYYSILPHDAAELVEALEPIMRPGGQGDAV